MLVLLRMLHSTSELGDDGEGTHCESGSENGMTGKKITSDNYANQITLDIASVGKFNRRNLLFSRVTYFNRSVTTIPLRFRIMARKLVHQAEHILFTSHRTT